MTITQRFLVAMSKPEGAVDRDLLGILEEPGRVRLIPWSKNSVDALAKHGELTQQKDAEGLRLLVDRYVRLSIDEKNRLLLPRHALHSTRLRVETEEDGALEWNAPLAPDLAAWMG